MRGVRRVDPRKLLGAGFLIGAVTLFWFATLDLNSGYWDFFWPQIVQGVGFGMLFVPFVLLPEFPGALLWATPVWTGWPASVSELRKPLGSQVPTLQLQPASTPGAKAIKEIIRIPEIIPRT